ncbi:membrane-bound PQQ-dependent dehydrogenase, glucose/quinate/shikimate family [Sphingomonas lycopersici]|uniref:Membrane-bound PQQ-dependent dehydrogenase, glucose/quinate/shikimate family n=1 Tax=Sphingomonas lycopersici TaxID=2951807 RepID=A0AA41Z9K6_9SPHN|nr:membrane-bound PQQ-dependent dehydrogenase, glucose/quinate/shikimate family [Sphingomonas lycopersici]MCW6536452.1 membrane-bound PQQ-dependent dehydrogenase, glucose/quinate/shikimate family [Sphingomonas lycopersici]
MRLYLRILGWIVALLGLFFAVAGAQLAWLGGSLYYLVAGLAMIAAGILLSRSDRRGALIYALVWLATWLWAVWEVGFDGLELIPRVVAPTVLLILVAWPWLWRRATRPRARQMAATAAVAGLVLAGAYAAFAPRTLSAQAAAPASGVAAGASTGDWTHYGGTLAGDRYSSLAQITPANVGQLQLVWTHRTGDLAMPDEAVKHLREYHSEATPIHIGDTLYTCTPHSYVEAIDATTGAAKWRWHTGADITGNSYLVCRGVSYYEAPAGTACAHRIFAPTFDAKMYALDADTGKPCAGFGKGGYIDLRDQMGVSPAAFQISTSPPVVANGRLIIGERIIDNVGVDEPAGVVRAYDPISGAPVWAWDIGRGDDAIKPLTGDAIYTRGTPNVWGAMTADAANGIVYLGTGNATPDYWIGRRRSFDDKYGTSIVALDIATGKMRWHRQLVHRDMWDMDVPVGPSLVDLPLPGGGIAPALVQTTKMGQVYLLNRLTGAPLAAIVEKPVSMLGGIGDEAMSPTQPFSIGMPSFTPPAPSETATWGATPIDQLICRIQFRKAHAAGIYAPIGSTDIIGHPAFDGVTDWGGGAVDPERGIFTVNTMEMPFRIRLVRADSAQGQKMIAAAAKGGENAKAPIYYQQFGTPYVAVVQAWIGPFGAPCSAPPWGRLTAVDLKTRQVMWTKVLGTARDTGLFGSHLGLPLKTGVPNLGGSIITRGGLVFIGATTDQYLRAFDLRTGAELWKARLPAGAQATPMTYRARDGRQYVVITAGGHGALGTRYGDYTLAFALPKAT